MKNQQSIDWILLGAFVVIAIVGLFFGMKIFLKFQKEILRKSLAIL
jgi:uncharacterized membrane protein YfcA